MYKILFYHANTLYYEDLENTLFLSIASIYFKTHIDLNDPEISDKIDWLLPIQKKVSDDELIEYCNSNQVDLLCISAYLWNESFFSEQLSRIKPKLNSNLKIVIGGPSVDVNINEAFFDKHSYADYAIYGQGEVAFSQLVSHLMQNKKLISFNLSNLAWLNKEKNKLVVCDYKNVLQSQTSPFLYNEKFFTDIVNHEQQKNGLKVVLPYELTRGCPYACTFCDWNSGLSNKVSRRKNTYKDEIDLFQKLKIQKIYFSDANFGQYEEDIDLVKYMVNKNLNENANFLTDGNLSKLRKDNNLKIYRLFAEGKLISTGWGFTFSVQDINETVLKNIDRPDVGWDAHKAMILDLHQHHPEYLAKIQFIIGLPGQTPTTIKESLAQIIDLPNVVLSPFISELLPASPAALDPTYQEKFNFQYSSSERLNPDGLLYRGKFPSSCFSFTQKEFVKMIVIASFFTGLANIRQEIDYKNLTLLHNTNLIVDAFIKSEQYQRLTNNLYTNWTKHDKFFYTIDFDSRQKNIPACAMTIAGANWVNSLTWKKMLIQLNFVGVEKSSLAKKIMHQKTLNTWFK
jgi:tRNA A37 methylthiotransferase MiaB